MIDDSYFELRGRPPKPKPVVDTEEYLKTQRYLPERIPISVPKPAIDFRLHAEDEIRYAVEKIIEGVGIPPEFVNSVRGQSAILDAAKALAMGMGGVAGLGSNAYGGGIAGAAYGESSVSRRLREYQARQAMQAEHYRQMMMATPSHVVVPADKVAYRAPPKVPTTMMENMEQGFPLNLKRLEELFEDWKMR